LIDLLEIFYNTEKIKLIGSKNDATKLIQLKISKNLWMMIYINFEIIYHISVSLYLITNKMIIKTKFENNIYKRFREQKILSQKRKYQSIFQNFNICQIWNRIH
jgi:hypothetical protein